MKQRTIHTRPYSYRIWKFLHAQSTAFSFFHSYNPTLFWFGSSLFWFCFCFGYKNEGNAGWDYVGVVCVWPANPLECQTDENIKENTTWKTGIEFSNNALLNIAWIIKSYLIKENWEHNNSVHRSKNDSFSFGKMYFSIYEKCHGIFEVSVDHMAHTNNGNIMHNLNWSLSKTK